MPFYEILHLPLNHFPSNRSSFKPSLPSLFLVDFQLSAYTVDEAEVEFGDDDTPDLGHDPCMYEESYKIDALEIAGH